MKCTHENIETWEQEGEIIDACEKCGWARRRTIKKILATLPTCQDLAEKYRAEDHSYHEQGGVVVICGTEVSGWMNELRDPHRWIAGCIAVGEDGNGWISRGGNYRDGAERWEPIKDHGKEG